MNWICLCFCTGMVINYSAQFSINRMDTLFQDSSLLLLEISSQNLLEEGLTAKQILRINPKCFDFKLISKFEQGQVKTAEQWVKSQSLNVIFNAGMYSAREGNKNRFYMKNFGFIENNLLNSEANGIIAFNAKRDSIPNFKLFDLTKSNLPEISADYNTLIQGIRMLDENGHALYWNKKQQRCSMMLLATDSQGYLYLIFSRPPQTKNQMIDFLLTLPLGLTHAIYLEGGFLAGFIINTPTYQFKMVGSYLEKYHPTDKNIDFHPFPNFIGLQFNASTCSN